MKLKEYIKELNKIIKENPEAKNLTVIYARDEEGNGFEEVYYTPSIGYFNDYEFYNDSGEEFKEKKLKVNSICIN